MFVWFCRQGRVTVTVMFAFTVAAQVHGLSEDAQKSNRVSDQMLPSLLLQSTRAGCGQPYLHHVQMLQHKCMIRPTDLKLMTEVNDMRTIDMKSLSSVGAWLHSFLCCCQGLTKHLVVEFWSLIQRRQSMAKTGA